MAVHYIPLGRGSHTNEHPVTKWYLAIVFCVAGLYERANPKIKKRILLAIIEAIENKNVGFLQSDGKPMEDMKRKINKIGQRLRDFRKGRRFVCPARLLEEDVELLLGTLDKNRVPLNDQVRAEIRGRIAQDDEAVATLPDIQDTYDPPVTMDDDSVFLAGNSASTFSAFVADVVESSLYTCDYEDAHDPIAIGLLMGDDVYKLFLAEEDVHSPTLDPKAIVEPLDMLVDIPLEDWS